MTGATLNSVLKIKLYYSCTTAVKTAIDNNSADVPTEITLLTEYADMGGLNRPKSGIYKICREVEREIQEYKDIWIKKEIPITATNVNDILSRCQNVDMPNCCSLKTKIINCYLTNDAKA